MSEAKNHPEDLLPWYVNGTLAGDELELVERHLAGCPRCREEIGFLGFLRDRIQAHGDGEGPGELARARLMRSIRRERYRSWLKPALAVAAAIVIAVQTVLLVTMVPRESAIAPLGAPASPGVVIQLQFVPTATEPEIRKLLQGAGATIIGGPGALGVYRVRLEGIRPDEQQRIADVLVALRAQSRIVSHAGQEP